VTTILNLGKYRPKLRFGGYFEKDRPSFPDHTEAFFKILCRPIEPLIEFFSVVVAGRPGYGKTELVNFCAEVMADFYGEDQVNAVRFKGRDIQVLLEEMDSKPVQILFLDDCIGDIDIEIKEQFDLVRHRYLDVLQGDGVEKRGIICVFFTIQTIFNIDLEYRRNSTAMILKSLSIDRRYNHELAPYAGKEGLKLLSTIERRVLQEYDQSAKSLSTIKITTQQDRPGKFKSRLPTRDVFRDVEPPPEASESRVFTYDVAGGFVENVQRLIRSRMPGHGEDCVLLYPWVIQGTPGTHISSLYPEMGSDRTVQRRIADLLEFLHSPETARVIGLEVFEPWFRSRMRDLGHSVTSSGSTARGGVDAVVDGVVHSLKCYHQNRNTISIPPTEISADEYEAAGLKGFLRLVVMNPFWGTNPRVAELTLEELRRLSSVTVTPNLPELDLSPPPASPAPVDPAPSQPLTDTGLKHPGAETETETRKTNDEAPARQRQEAAQGATPSAAEPTINEAAGSGVETGEAQKRLDEDLDPVAVMKAKKLIELALEKAGGSVSTTLVLDGLLVQMGRVRDSGEGELTPLIIGDAITYIERCREALP